jgi:nucleotide-binding universal stress UspA family protein
MQSTARFLLGPIADKVSRKVDCDLLIVETSE